MIRGRLAELAAGLRGRLSGPDRPFTGVSTDTRSLEPGQLFVALQGPHYDAHDFLVQAAAAGAAGAVVSEDLEAGLPQIRVPDTLAALGRLAADWRARFAPTVLGVTGSAGKTTVKEMLATILSARADTLVTRGNLNNEIGVPLTLFGLADRHRYAVIEMGANHAGEIARLAAMARPDIGVVTMAGASHLEGFGSLDGVARAKGELFAALGSDGTAIVNADDPHAAFWCELCGGARVVRFGLQAGADVTAARIEPVGEGGEGHRFELITPRGTAEVVLPLPGRHNVMNALAASAAAMSAGLDPDEIGRGLAGSSGIDGRLRVRPGPRGSRIVDDTYNANPSSMRVALDFLASLSGHSWAVLGDMYELGDCAEALHREIGEYARSRGVERLLAIGPRSRAMAAGLGAGAEHYDDADEVIETLHGQIGAGVQLLVKGSRAMRLEKVVSALAAAAECETTAEDAG